MTLARDLELRVVAQTVDGVEVGILLDPSFAGFAGHFPGAPVLPGMCHIDLALRAASLLAGASLDLAEIERARFVRRVLPGEELRIRVKLAAEADGARIVIAEHLVGDEPAASLRLRVVARA